MPLIYVIGASGSGKDSLMRYGRERLADNPNVLFAHRYITRPANAGGENHVALSREEFYSRIQAGLFALDWESHGNLYGVGIEIDQWLAKGMTVVVNGSREYLPEAKKRYPALVPIRVEVSERTLRARLEQRARESEADIVERLNRHALLSERTHGGVAISNDGAIGEGGEALVGIILQNSARIKCA